MIDAVAKLHASLEFMNTEEAQPAANQDSLGEKAANQEKIDAGVYAEHAALALAGTNARLILKKTKLEGVTVAIAEAE
jgi:cobalamin biosynthesis protein CbiG